MRRPPAPFAFERAPRSLYGEVDIHVGALGQSRNRIPCCGIDGVEVLPGRRGPPLTINQKLLGTLDKGWQNNLCIWHVSHLSINQAVLSTLVHDVPIFTLPRSR